ncbi:MAG: hypothetical protein HYR63_10925 [Proteobacteria bacterium]|nr:hypothetical protein [Pseudomonadota bacterium]MBI3498264.1 hypothetical protein [Pseudomonadota bacterium]
MAHVKSAFWWNSVALRAEIDCRVRVKDSHFEQCKRQCTPQVSGQSNLPFDTEQASESARDLLERTIDSLSLGVLLVGEGGRVIILNSAAEALLASCDGLMLLGQTLAATRPFEDEMMRQEIARTLTREDRCAGPSYTVATASRLSGMAPYLLLFAPLERGLTAAGPSESATLIVIEDPEQPLPDLSQQLRVAFQIVEGGSEVVTQIMESHGLSDVVGSHGARIRTIRALVKALYAGTNVPR